jgi:hypothetical protein
MLEGKKSAPNRIAPNSNDLLNITREGSSMKKPAESPKRQASRGGVRGVTDAVNNIRKGKN